VWPGHGRKHPSPLKQGKPLIKAPVLWPKKAASPAKQFGQRKKNFACDLNVDSSLLPAKVHHRRAAISLPFIMLQHILTILVLASAADATPNATAMSHGVAGINVTVPQ
jgi:hypothetical protein